MKELERIDGEADDLEIMFVKIRDVRYARKYGIATIPTLVFFRKKFPSVYRGIVFRRVKSSRCASFASRLVVNVS